MTRPRVLVAIMVLLVALAALQYLRVPPRPTIFTNQTFEEAQAAAAGGVGGKGGKLLVVDFAASWCGACREMDRNTWTNPQLVDWLKEHAITVKVDIDADKARARAFGVTAIPVVLVLSGGREVARVTGAVPAGELLTRLKAAAGASSAETARSIGG